MGKSKGKKRAEQVRFEAHIAPQDFGEVGAPPELGLPPPAQQNSPAPLPIRVAEQIQHGGNATQVHFPPAATSKSPQQNGDWGGPAADGWATEGGGASIPTRRHTCTLYLIAIPLIFAFANDIPYSHALRSCTLLRSILKAGAMLVPLIPAK